MLERTRSSGTPPYTSYRTFKTFIEDLHEQGVPSRIDRSVGRCDRIINDLLDYTRVKSVWIRTSDDPIPDPFVMR